LKHTAKADFVYFFSSTSVLDVVSSKFNFIQNMAGPGGKIPL
jgi:hypothetical protein